MKPLNVYLFTRNLTYKFLFDKDHLRTDRYPKGSNVAPWRIFALCDLILLMEENDQSDTTGSQLSSTPSLQTPLPTAKFKLKSQRFPDLMTNPNVCAFLSSTVNDIKRMTITPRQNNLNKTTTTGYPKTTESPRP